VDLSHGLDDLRPLDLAWRRIASVSPFSLSPTMPYIRLTPAAARVSAKLISDGFGYSENFSIDGIGNFLRISPVCFTPAFVPRKVNQPQGRAIPRFHASPLSRQARLGGVFSLTSNGVTHGLHAQHKRSGSSVDVDGDTPLFRDRAVLCVPGARRWRGDAVLHHAGG
jgi:hypothetical protein